MLYSNVNKAHLNTAKLINDSVCFDTLNDYSLELKSSDIEQFTHLSAVLIHIAKLEVGHMLKNPKVSEQAMIVHWLMGLPSVVTVPFNYFEIDKILLDLGVMKPTDNEDKIELLRQQYWDRIAFVLLSNARKCSKDIK